jgi:integrase
LESTKKAGGQLFNSPKGGVDRWVDMSLQLKDTLLAHLERYPTEEGWVFYHRDGLPIHPVAFYRVWGKFFNSTLANQAANGTL